MYFSRTRNYVFIENKKKENRIFLLKKVLAHLWFYYKVHSSLQLCACVWHQLQLVIDLASIPLVFVLFPEKFLTTPLIVHFKVILIACFSCKFNICQIDSKVINLQFLVFQTIWNCPSTLVFLSHCSLIVCYIAVLQLFLMN